MQDDVQISVSKEFYEHYKEVISLRDDIINNEHARDADKVSVINSTTNIIKDLLHMQERLYNSENFAKLQQIIVQCLREVSPEVANRAIERMEEEYAKII